ncbi:hypothetical protein HDU96_009029 [Phlyctochytrium bullatum]|nr:hypothetical protein HDU96_009029 [Phlyctochytrium bullatum]
MADEQLPLASFVSDYVRKILEDGPKWHRVEEALAKGRPYSENIWTALLMIDISGFSLLTSKLAVFGKISSELITSAVCSLMNKIIGVVVQFEGDVVKFLGDAIIVSFRGSESTKDQAIQRAFRCAMTILTRFPAEPVDLSPLKNAAQFADVDGGGKKRKEMLADEASYMLRLHMALVAGLVEHVIAGVPESRADYFLHGECFQYLEPLLSSAKAGEIGVEELAWKIVADGFHTEKRNLPTARPITHGFLLSKAGSEHTKETDSFSALPGSVSYEALVESIMVAPAENASIRNQFLSKFVNASIAHQYANGQMGSMKQYREVTIIFVKILDGFEQHVAQEAVAAFIRSLDDFGGVFQQYSIDDKGQSLLGCFGLPPFTYENNSSRALNCALRFVETFTRCPAYCSVTTGTILFARLGNRSRSEASLLGDVVNYGSRLLGLATMEHRVVCDAKTASGAGDFVKGVLGSFRVKGSIEEKEVWFVDKASAAIKEEKGKGGITYGYQTEKRGILAALQSWMVTKNLKVIVVEGPSGFGKTTLLNYFQSQVVSLDAPSYYVASMPKEKQLVPFSSIKPIIFHLVTSEISNDRASGRSSDHLSTLSPFGTRREGSLLNGRTALQSKDLKAFLTHIGENPDLSPLLNTFFYTGDIFETDATRKMSPEARNSTLIALVANIITVLSWRRDLILIFDDLQWIDTLSLQILIALAQGKGNIFFFCCSRPFREQGRKDLDEVITMRDDIVHLVLEGLKNVDVEDMVLRQFSHLGATSVDAALMKLLVDKTSSSPLSLQVTLEVLAEKELLTTNQSKMLSFSQSALGKEDQILAEIIGNAVIIQFDRLEFQFQEFLRTASIFGQYFDVLDVMELLESEEDPARFLDLIRTEDRFGFLKEVEPNEEATLFFFRHISIVNAIYESLSFLQRSAKHAQVGAILEKKRVDKNCTVLLPSLFHHYSRTDLTEKRITYAEELGLYYMKSSFKHEAFVVMKNLCEFVESLEEIPSQFTDKLRRAQWYSTLAAATVPEWLPDATINAGNKALWLLDIPVETLDRLTLWKVVRAGMRQRNTFLKTKGGTCLPAGSGDPIDVRRRLCADEALAAMLESMAVIEKYPLYYKFYLLMVLMNQCIMLAQEVPSVWAKRCMFMAYGGILTAPFISVRYYAAGRAFWDKCPPEDLVETIEAFWMNTYCLGNLSELDNVIKTFMEVSKRNHDKKTLQILTNFSFLLEYPIEFEPFLQAQKDRLDERDSLDTTYAWVSLINVGFMPTSTESARSMVRAWRAVMAGDFQESIDALEDMSVRCRREVIYTFNVTSAYLTLLAFFPLLFTLKTIAPADQRPLRRKLKTLLSGYEVLFRKTTKYPDTNHAIFFVRAIKYMLRGRTKAPRAIFLTLLKPQYLDRMKVGTPNHVGFIYFGLWLLDGRARYFEQARASFEDANGAFFVEMLSRISDSSEY